MVRVEAEISASVGGFPVDFGGQCRLFLMTRIYRKGLALSGSISIVKWIENLKILRWLRKSCNRSGPRGQTTNVSSTYQSHSDGLCCAKSQFLKILHVCVANDG
jgi:hypothetical protein